MILRLDSLWQSQPIFKAQRSTHKVQKGDTLWSKFAKILRYAFSGAKLWEMNPFVTNPHLLKPGDVITLIEKRRHFP